MSRKDVAIVALTGGPCGGKSSLFDALKERQHLGGRSLCFVPEAATILINDGCDSGDVEDFQRAILGLQLELEAHAMEQAYAMGVPAAVICDRGTMDGAAYCTADQFVRVMAAHGYSREALLARYDLVVHLVSAAVDAPEAYTTGNNEARFEDLNGAIDQEYKTRTAWLEHPNRLVLGGYDSFAAKLQAAVDAIESYLESCDGELHVR